LSFSCPSDAFSSAVIVLRLSPAFLYSAAACSYSALAVSQSADHRSSVTDALRGELVVSAAENVHADGLW
jgi:hypothetical protein